MPKYLSGRVKRTSQSALSSERYRYLSVADAEPNIGDPVAPGDIVPFGQQYQIVSIEGYPGKRYWVPIGGGLIPGSITVFDESNLVGGINSTTQLNFVGAAISAQGSNTGSSNPGVAVTVRVIAPGNDKEILFNTSNEFSTSTKLTFDSTSGLLTAGDRIIVGSGGTVITTTGIGSVGIGTTNPTQELHVQGDLRLTGTIYDYNNQPGSTSNILVKNNLGGLTWAAQGTIKSGAGGTYQNIQFHNNAGLVDGAPTFVYDEINNRVGVGSTQPKVTLDVLGISSFKGGAFIDNLLVSGVTTTSTLAVSGTSTTRNLLVTGITTIGFVTGTSAYFTGIVTASKFTGAVDITNLYVTGVSTFNQKVNINSDLGVTGFTTTQDLRVYQSTTLNRLNVSGISTFDSQVNVNNLYVTGVGTFDNIKLDTNTLSTNIGNLIIDSSAGTTQINDSVYINDGTQSTDKDTGSIITEGGVGIEKNLNVGGAVSFTGPSIGVAVTLAAAGGITTTGGDLYVGGNLYLKQDIYQDEIFARNGFFTGIVSTKDLISTGISTLATLGVGGLTTTRNLRVTGVSTFDGLIDANGGAYIDNIQIGITNDNTIDTTSGNLTIDSSGGTTTINDQLRVSGVSTFTDNVVFGDASTDLVTFNSRVNSNILPSTNGTLDLGGSSNNWNNVYANTFIGRFTGNADTATQVSTGTTTGTSSYYLTFVDSNNTTRGNEFLYTDNEISYNPNTDLLSVGKLYATGISTFGSDVTIGRNLYVNGYDFVLGIGDQVTRGNSGSSRALVKNTNATLSINHSGDFTGGVSVGSTLYPSGNGTWNLGTPTLYWNNVFANNFVGKITGNADTATQVSTGTTTGNTDYYLTFVDSNNTTRGNEFLYTDNEISYNPSTDLLSVGKLYISGISTFNDNSTFNGNVTLGDATSDTVSFISRVGTGITPSTTDTYDLGNSSLRWNNVYAKTFVGTFTGIADTAKKLETPRNFSINGNSSVINAGDINAATVSFDGTQNVVLNGSLKNVTGLISGTYGSGSIVPVVSVNSQGIVTSITTTAVNFSTATVQNADRLTTPRNIDIDGDVIGVGIGTTFDGSQNVTIPTVLSNTGVVAGTYGSSTTVGILTVDAKGRITAASNVGINFSAATVAQADAVKTVSNSTSATFYPTFVDTDNASAAYEALYTDSGISYNPSTNLLTVGNLTVSGVSTFNGNVVFGDANTDTVNFVSKVNSNIIPSGVQNLGSVTEKWDNLYVNTIVGNVTGAASSLSVTNDTSNSSRYFVLSSTTSGITTALVDSNITYNPSTDLLTVNAIKPSSIQDSTGNTGTNNYVLTSNGSGGWSWKVASTSGGNAAISGITISDEGTSVATGITTINFVGSRITATAGATGIATVTVSDSTVNAAYADNAGIATNIKGGAAGSIPYQSSADNTTFVNVGVAGSILTSDGTKPVWTSFNSTNGTLIPTGSVFYFAASTAPSGYLTCNGASLSTTTYSALFSIIGYTFGGSGATFNLPDLRGEFIRGWDSSRGVDIGRVFGSFQSQSYQSHSHNITDPGHSHSFVRTRYGTAAGGAGNAGAEFGSAPTSGFSETGVNGNTTGIIVSNNGGTETRPRNVALLPCIKY